MRFYSEMRIYEKEVEVEKDEKEAGSQKKSEDKESNHHNWLKTPVNQYYIQASTNLS